MLRFLKTSAIAFAISVSVAPAFAQTSPPTPRPAPETWVVKKGPAGVYPGPGKPIWRLADLKKAHAGQTNWRQLIVDDGRQRAVYFSAKPGTQAGPVMHPVSQTMFVVIAGKIRFKLDKQPDLIATRGSVVNILDSMIYSYEVLEGDTALWIQVDPNNVTDVYPSSAPPPASVGATTKLSFNRRATEYLKPNKPHFNLFEAVAACDAAGARVKDDHIFASVVMGYATAADPANNCPSATGGPPGASGPPAPPPIVDGKPFGHMHTDMAEWWIIQSGGVKAKFEGQPELHAVEGDVLYAPMMTWHQLATEGPGLSERLAITAFPFINLNSVAE